MALTVQDSVRQSRRQPGEGQRRETRFDRYQWNRITQGEGKDPRVTIWDGVKAVVIALSFPDGNPGDIEVSVVEDCLLVGGTVGNGSVRQTIELPCPVETRPIRIEDDKGTLFVLLQKK